MFRRKAINKKPIGNSVPTKKSFFTLPSGIFPTNVIDRAYNAIFGNLPYHVKEFLKKKGDLKIVSPSYVARLPINSIIDKVLNVLSLGKFNEAKGKLGYDDFFHLFLVLTLSDGSRIRLEKNQDINIEPGANIDGAESIELNLDGFDSQLDEALDRTRLYMGDSNFYKYDAFKNNCQDWVLSFVKSNDLDKKNSGIELFIKQSAKEILESMPDYASKIANIATGAGSYVNKFLSSISGGRIHFEEGGLVI